MSAKLDLHSIKHSSVCKWKTRRTRTSAAPCRASRRFCRNSRLPRWTPGNSISSKSSFSSSQVFVDPKSRARKCLIQAAFLLFALRRRERLGGEGARGEDPGGVLQHAVHLQSGTLRSPPRPLHGHPQGGPQVGQSRSGRGL